MEVAIERFVQEVPEALKCTVCWNVFRKPVTCICGHTFCKECIDTWRSENQQCPVCRTALPDAMFARSFITESLISSLEVRCKFSPSGCPQVHKLESVFAHEKECNFEPVACPHAGCTLSALLRSQLAEHIAQCSFRVVDCPERCRYKQSGPIIQMRAKDVQAHLNNECPNFNVLCDLGCEKQVRRCNLSTHKQNDCPKQPIRCHVMDCQFKAPRDDVDSWLKHWGLHSPETGTPGADFLASLQLHNALVSKAVGSLDNRLQAAENLTASLGAVSFAKLLSDQQAQHKNEMQKLRSTLNKQNNTIQQLKKELKALRENQSQPATSTAQAQQPMLSVQQQPKPRSRQKSQNKSNQGNPSKPNLSNNKQ